MAFVLKCSLAFILFVIGLVHAQLGLEADKVYFSSLIDQYLTSIPQLIDNAKEITVASQKLKRIKRLSQGWSIVVGSWLDISSDFLINNRTLSNLGGVTTGYYYSALAHGVGVGFGFPVLVNLPKYDLRCGSDDFRQMLSAYGLQSGVDQMLNNNKSNIGFVRSVVTEFNIKLRTSLSCILDLEEEYIEVSEVSWALDEFNAVMNLRIEVEQEQQDQQQDQKQN